MVLCRLEVAEGVDRYFVSDIMPPLLAQVASGIEKLNFSHTYPTCSDLSGQIGFS